MESTEQLCLFCDGIGTLSLDNYPEYTNYVAKCFICDGTGKIRVVIPDSELDKSA